MKISETYELEGGTVRFVGELDGPELDLVIQTGLLTLMKHGVIATAFAEKQQVDEGDLH